MQQIIASYCN